MYSDSEIQAIWNKASWAIENLRVKDPKFWRKDHLGNLINRFEYGKLSDFGWEVDHIIPVSLGGQNFLSNLRALHWRSNRSRGNNIFGLLRNI